MAQVLTTESQEEVTALAHLRGWCHHAPTCPICVALDKAREFGARRAIERVATGA